MEKNSRRSRHGVVRLENRRSFPNGTRTLQCGLLTPGRVIYNSRMVKSHDAEEPELQDRRVKWSCVVRTGME